MVTHTYHTAGPMFMPGSGAIPSYGMTQVVPIASAYPHSPVPDCKAYGQVVPFDSAYPHSSVPSHQPYGQVPHAVPAMVYPGMANSTMSSNQAYGQAPQVPPAMMTSGGGGHMLQVQVGSGSWWRILQGFM